MHGCVNLLQKRPLPQNYASMYCVLVAYKATCIGKLFTISIHIYTWRRCEGSQEHETWNRNILYIVHTMNRWGDKCCTKYCTRNVLLHRIRLYTPFFSKKIIGPCFLVYYFLAFSIFLSQCATPLLDVTTKNDKKRETGPQSLEDFYFSVLTEETSKINPHDKYLYDESGKSAMIADGTSLLCL